MIQILKKQKEEIENEIPIEDFLKNNLSEKFEDLGLGEDENEDIENIEEILNSMTDEEKRLFEEAIKDNSIVEDIKSKLKPWVCKIQFCVFGRHRPKNIFKLTFLVGRFV